MRWLLGGGSLSALAVGRKAIIKDFGLPQQPATRELEIAAWSRRVSTDKKIKQHLFYSSTFKDFVNFFLIYMDYIHIIVVSAYNQAG